MTQTYAQIVQRLKELDGEIEKEFWYISERQKETPVYAHGKLLKPIYTDKLTYLMNERDALENLRQSKIIKSHARRF